MILRLCVIFGYLATLLVTTGAAPAGEAGGGGHAGDLPDVLIGLIAMIAVAKLGGDLFQRVHLPPVLGELVGGVLMGNFVLLGVGGFEFIVENPVIAVLAELGVILLLFEVGLESTVREMATVGFEAFLVAILGVIAPFFLGWGVGALFLPDESVYVHIFLGATLCATSVGITARVLKDIGKSRSREAKIILGAAVIDDVMGLIILATVVGIIEAARSGGELAPATLFTIVGKATIFLVASIGIGLWLSPRLFGLASRMRVSGVLVSTALMFCFLLSYLAYVMGLAPIVGAFAAGLILEELHFKDFKARGEVAHLEELIAPIGFLLIPLFFVRMGAQVDITAFGRVEILGFAAVLTIAAIIGKQLCSLGVLSKGTNRLAVGLGMIPRGEVGLIFIGIGASLVDPEGHRVISSDTFSAVVIMVIITTMITPPVFKWALLRGEKSRST